MKQLLSTASVSSRERVAFWVDMICSTYVHLDCDPKQVKASGFEGSIERHSLAQLEMSVIRSHPQSVFRTHAAIARDAEDCFLVATQSIGHGYVEQGGRETLMGPGDFSIYHSARPYTLRFNGAFEEIILKIPGDALRAVMPAAEAFTAVKVAGGSGPGRLLSGMLETLRRDAESLPPPAARSVGDTLVSLVAAGLQAGSERPRALQTALQSYHLERIRRCIEDNLHDPNLTMEAVARQLGMSVGHLHRLFAAEPMTPAQFLMGRRLEYCSRDLLDARWAMRPVSEIGFRWGFNDAAHFSRAFRQRFGLPPREWRMRALRSRGLS